MAHQHQHKGGGGINFGAIGQKIKQFGEVAAAAKGIVETAVFLKNTLQPVVSTVGTVAAMI